MNGNQRHRLEAARRLFRQHKRIQRSRRDAAENGVRLLRQKKMNNHRRGRDLASSQNQCLYAETFVTFQFAPAGLHERLAAAASPFSVVTHCRI